MTITYWPPFMAAILLLIAFGFMLGWMAACAASNDKKYGKRS